MTDIDYANLIKQLNNLMREAPCHDGACVGSQSCEYGVNGCYGDECAIEIVSNTAYAAYEKMIKEVLGSGL